MNFTFSDLFYGSHSISGFYRCGGYGYLLVLTIIMTSILAIELYPPRRACTLLPETEKMGGVFYSSTREDTSCCLEFSAFSAQDSLAESSESGTHTGKDAGTPSGTQGQSEPILTVHLPKRYSAPLLPKDHLHIPYLQTTLNQEEQQMLREVFLFVGTKVVDKKLDKNNLGELCEKLSQIHRLTGPKIIDCLKEENGQDLYTILKALSCADLFPGKQLVMPYHVLGFICSLASCYMSPDDYNGFSGIVLNIYEHIWGFKENFTSALGMGKDRAQDNRGDAREGGFLPNIKAKEESPVGRKTVDETFAKSMRALCEISGFDSEPFMEEFESDRYRETLPSSAKEQDLKTSHGAMEEGLSGETGNTETPGKTPVDPEKAQKGKEKAPSDPEKEQKDQEKEPEKTEEICPTVEQLEQRYSTIASKISEIQSFFEGCASTYQGIIDARACLILIQELLEDTARELEAIKAMENAAEKETSNEKESTTEDKVSMEETEPEQSQEISVSLEGACETEYSRHCLHSILSLIENLVNQLMAVVENTRKTLELDPDKGIDHYQLHKDIRSLHLSRKLLEMMAWKRKMDVYKSISQKKSPMKWEGNRRSRRLRRKMMRSISDFKNALKHAAKGKATITKPFDLVNTIVNTLKRLEALIHMLEEHQGRNKSDELKAVLDCLKSAQKYLVEKASPEQRQGMGEEARYNLGLLFKKYGCVYQDWLNILKGYHTQSAKIKKLCGLVCEKNYQNMQETTVTRYESSESAMNTEPQRIDGSKTTAASVQENATNVANSEGVMPDMEAASQKEAVKGVAGEKYSQVRTLIQDLQKVLSDGKDEKGAKLTPKAEEKINTAMGYLDDLLARLKELGDSTLKGEDENAIYALKELAERLLPKLEPWHKICQGECTKSYGTAMNLASAIPKKRVASQIEKAFKAFEKRSVVGEEKPTVWKDGRPDHYNEAGVENCVGPLESDGYAPVRETIEIIRKFISDGKNPLDLRIWLEYLMTKEGVKVYSDPSHDYKYCSITGRQLQNGLRYYTGLKFTDVTLANFMYNKMGYSRVQNGKIEQVGTPHPLGEAQRENIKKRIEEVDRETTLIISIDTKAQVVLGRFKHDSTKVLALRGHLPSMKDHDYVQKMCQIYIKGTSLVDESRMNENAVLYPVGAYCLNDHSAYVALILGKDTAESMGNLIQTVINEKKKTMPKLKEVLILADGGGANSANGILWLDELLRVTEKTGVDIEVRHYAPGTSKFNAVERFWSKVSISWRGKPLLDIEHVAKYIRQAKDEVNKLQVHCWFDSKKYYNNSAKKEMGIEVQTRKGLENKANGRIVHLYEAGTDFFKWNYKVYASAERAAAARKNVA